MPGFNCRIHSFPTEPPKLVNGLLLQGGRRKTSPLLVVLTEKPELVTHSEMQVPHL